MPAPFNVIAAGQVDGATGNADKVAGATPARTGAGVYTITLGQDVDATECVCLVTPGGTAAIHAVCTQTSDSVKTVRTFDAAGAAADADFSFVIAQFSFSS